MNETLADQIPFSSGWSLGETGYALLRADLLELEPVHLVEYGAGTSTVHLSHDFPDATIWSHEHHSEYAETTRQQLLSTGGPARVHVTTTPLAWHFFGGAFFLSYSRGPLPPSADAIFIDGPPYWTRRGREACLYQSHRVLRVGGRVYLDDYRRPSEQRIVRNWLQAFGGAFRVMNVLESSHRICVLEKVAATSEPEISVRHLADAAHCAFRYAMSRARGHIPS